MCAALNRLFALFQSTLSMRRATHRRYWTVNRKRRFQSTLSMRRATKASKKANTASKFQSTLSMRRATTGRYTSTSSMLQFQSTLSMRRATVCCRLVYVRHDLDFNPRSP